jgi:hypothetical protein
MASAQVREVRQRILAQGKNSLPAEKFRSLQEDDYYGSPYSFWSSAKAHGLCTDAEMKAAEISYGNLWHYRGD